MGGNGAAMRTGIIGIILHKEEDIENVIKFSITASRVTHNTTLGFLGGLVSALFANFGMREIHFLDWFEELFKLEKKIDKKIDYLLHLAGQSSGEISFENPVEDLKKNILVYEINSKSKKEICGK